MDSATIDVLLIEDNPGDARMLEELLAERGGERFRLTWTDRLQKGLEHLAAHDVDLVFLDLSLPECQGVETMDRVLAEAPQVPVVVLTGLDDETIAVEAARRGAQDYLVKGRLDGGMLVRAARYAVQRNQAEEAARRENAKLSAMISGMEEGVVFADAENRIVEANEYFCRLVGTERDELLGRRIAEIHSGPTRRRIEALIERFRANPDGEPFVVQRPLGEAEVILRVQPISTDGRYDGVLLNVVDVTELVRAREALEEANRRLKELATTDELTGLWNRRRFMEMLEHEFRRRRRRDSPLSLALIDVDHFKEVNDNRGHAFGDLLLKEVAGTMRRISRASDVVARYGGDEFVILMPDARETDALQVASRLQDRISGLQVSDGAQTLRATLSIGVASAEPNVGNTPESLIRLADEALYAAKNAGRDAVRSWSQIRRDEQAAMPSRREAIEEMQRRLQDLSARSREMFLQSIEGLVEMLEARDPHTKSHTERVARFAVGIARTLGLREAEVDTIRRAAQVHDLGKIGVPDGILRKPGPLSAAERRVMEQHVLIGVRILEQLRFLDRELPIVRHHHERWTGGGYPDGIAGGAIPPGARILAVADALEALTSARVHRPARALPDALRILVEEAGTHFDPRVVDAALAWAAQTKRALDHDPTAGDLAATAAPAEAAAPA